MTIQCWQKVHHDEELYSVQSMAELMFGNTDATFCYVSHYLLSQEHIYFKQDSRNPHLFQARSRRGVNALWIKRDAEEQVCSWLCTPQQSLLTIDVRCVWAPCSHLIHRYA